METKVRKGKSWKRLGTYFLAVVAAVVLTIVGMNLTVVQQDAQPLKVLFTVGNPVDAFTGTVDYVGTTSTAVQQALDALPATGGEIELVSPVYTFTATVSRAINNVTVKGNNGTTCNNDAVTPLFSVGAQTGWKFEDIRTDAGGITNYTNAYLDNVTLGTSYYSVYKTTGTALINQVIPTSTLVTISGGAIAPTVQAGNTCYYKVAGEGGVDDTLTTITADSSFQGKYIVLEMSGAGTITVQAGAGIIMSVDFTLDDVDDKLTLFYKADNTFVEVSRANNG